MGHLGNKSVTLDRNAKKAQFKRKIQMGDFGILYMPHTNDISLRQSFWAISDIVPKILPINMEKFENLLTYP